MNKIIVSLLFVIILISCNLNNIDKSFRNDINDYKTKCSDKPFDTFINMDSIVLPEYKNLNTIYPGSLKYEEHSGVQLLCEYDSLTFKRMTSLIKNKTILQLSFADTANYHMIDSKKKYNYKDLDKKLPFPELDDNFSKFKEKIDLDNSTIHFVSYGEGVFIKTEIIADKYNKLNEYFKTGVHGYSNGAVVDSLNKRIIYWIMIF